MFKNVSSMAIILVCLATSRAIRGNESVPLIGTTITSFTWGDRTIRVHPFLKNPTLPPEQRQFRYPPLFVPEVTEGGKLDVVTTSQGKEWHIRLRIWLSNPFVSHEALKATREAYPEVSDKLRGGNVTSIQVETIKLTAKPPKGRLHTTEINPGTASSFDVVFTAESPVDAKAIEQWLRGPTGSLQIEYSFEASNAKRNIRRVTMQMLAKSSLKAKLDGIGNGEEVYVHRDDFRTLTDDIQWWGEDIVYIEKPEAFQSGLVEKLLAIWNKSIELDYKSWGKEKWQTTYHMADTAPSIISRDFKKLFTYDKVTRRYKVNVKAKTGGSFGIGPLRFGGNLSGDYSKDELVAMLKKRGLECVVEGEIIKPQKLRVRRVNMGKFNSKIDFLQMRIYQGQVRSLSRRINLQLLNAAQGVTVRNIAARLGQLEKHLRINKETVILVGRTVIIKANTFKQQNRTGNPILEIWNNWGAPLIKLYATGQRNGRLEMIGQGAVQAWLEFTRGGKLLGRVPPVDRKK